MHTINQCTIEPLEGRRLLSWTTVDDFVQPLADPQAEFPETYAIPSDMAADSSGGVYVAGESWDYSFYPDDRGYALLRYKSGSGSGFQTIASVQSTGTFIAKFYGVATAPDESVYLCGLKGYAGGSLQRIWKGSWDASGTTFSLAEVDSQSTTSFRDITVDGAGNAFALGQYTANNGAVHWVVRKQTAGQGAFVTVNDYVYSNSTSTYPSAITAIRSGPNAGVYVVGNAAGRWLVRKSSNAGTTWSTVDAFQLEPSTNAPAAATAITADDNGTLHVVGRASVRVQTGGTVRKPIYSFFHRWYMRSSSNGGSSWTNHDVYPGSAGTPTAVTTDLAGNTYVAGTVNSRGIVRTNAGGSWSTSDDAQVYADGQENTCMTRDAEGTVYVGGWAMEPAPTYDGHWIVRSMTPAATAHSSSSGTGGSIFADSRIAEANDDRLEELS